MDKKEKETNQELDTDMHLERENQVSNLILASKQEFDKNLDRILEGKNYIKNF